VKALAAQGLSTGLLTPSSAPAPPSSSDNISQPQATSQAPPTPAMTAVPSFPISPAPTTPASVDFDDLSTSPESSMLGLSNTPIFSPVDLALEPTRHLARVATITPRVLSLQRVDSMPLSTVNKRSITLHLSRPQSRHSTMLQWSLYSRKFSRRQPSRLRRR